MAQAIDGTGNLITAAICTMTGNTMTGNQPASVCTPSVTGLQSKLVSASGG